MTSFIVIDDDMSVRSVLTKIIDQYKLGEFLLKLPTVYPEKNS